MLLDIRSKLSDNSKVFSKKIYPGDLVRYKSHPERKNDIGLVMQIVKGDQSLYLMRERPPIFYGLTISNNIVQYTWLNYIDQLANV